MKSFDKLLDDMDRLIEIQEMNGNWDYDRYMHGMCNGMILIRNMLAQTLHRNDFELKDAPESWRYINLIKELHDNNPELKKVYDEYLFLLNITYGNDYDYFEEIHRDCGITHRSLSGKITVQDK